MSKSPMPAPAISAAKNIQSPSCDTVIAPLRGSKLISPSNGAALLKLSLKGILLSIKSSLAFPVRLVKTRASSVTVTEG